MRAPHADGLALAPRRSGRCRRAAGNSPKPCHTTRAQSPHTRRSRRAMDGELKHRMDASSPCASSGGRRRAGARAQACCNGRAAQAMDGAQTSAASAGRQALCCRSSTQMKHKDVLAAVDIARVGRARGFAWHGCRAPRQTGRMPATNNALCLRPPYSPVSRRRRRATERGLARRYGDGGRTLRSERLCFPRRLAAPVGRRRLERAALSRAAGRPLSSQIAAQLGRRRLQRRRR